MSSIAVVTQIYLIEFKKKKKTEEKEIIKFFEKRGISKIKKKKKLEIIS